MISIAGTFGCTSEVDPALIHASVVSFGEFEIRAGLPTLSLKTTKIDCQQGKIFGVDYRIDVADGAWGILPIDFRWVHPELAVPSRGLWGPETPTNQARPHLGWGESQLAGRALWNMDHEDELISGRYEFQVRQIEDGKVLLSQPFEVEGC